MDQVHFQLIFHELMLKKHFFFLKRDASMFVCDAQI